MPVEFKIKISKEILELSKECGTHNDHETIGEECAIVGALKNIFPEVVVTGHYIYPFGMDENDKLDELKIVLPDVAQDFVKIFDSLCAIPNARLLLPELEFDITIPDEVIAEINIDEVRASYSDALLTH